MSAPSRALDVHCPTCDAEPDYPCTSPGPYHLRQRVMVLATPHTDRVIAARTETFAGLTAPKPRRSWWRDQPINAAPPRGWK